MGAILNILFVYLFFAIPLYILRKIYDLILDDIAMRVTNLKVEKGGNSNVQ